MGRKVIRTQTILPCQSNEAVDHLLSPEQRLMMALLVDALNSYQNGAFSSRPDLQRLHLDAEQWFLDGDRRIGNSITFTMVCDALGIDCDDLRRRIFGWKHSVMTTTEPALR